MSRRLLWHAVITCFVLGAANGLIFQKEMVLRHGQSMLLKLAPVDPRSLMQGDYMALRYDLLGKLPPQNDRPQASGRIVVRTDEANVASFVRLDGGEPLAAGEHFLKFRQDRDRARLGAESYFFQEGQADRFAKAKYGELKVAPNGGSVLVGLCDERRQRIAVTPALK